jgi:hypothetical protein
MVAREGIAPSTSLCRRDMILFHHRAVEARLAKTGCRGWNRTSIRAFKGRRPTVRRPGNKWWPARVTRPVLRIKSPLHHFNACRPKTGSSSRSSTSEGWCSWQGSHLHCRRSRRRASSGWATRANTPGRSLPPAQCSAKAESLDLLRARRCKNGLPGRNLTGEGWSACRVTLPDSALI